MSRDKDRFRETTQIRQEGMRRVEGGPALYLLTDPVTAERVVLHGFDEAGVWSQHATVSLFDRVVGDVGGAIVRVNIAPANVPAVMRCEVVGPEEGYRRFAVPLQLVTDAYLARLAEPA